MGIRWFLLGTCILCCMNQIDCESSEGQETPSIGESTARLLGTLFGFKPCIDESCSGYEPNTPSGGKHGSPTKTPELVPGEDDYEPQEQDDKYPREYPEVHCIKLRPSAIKAFQLLESRHPDIMGIKYKVLEDVINYASSVSAFRSENCSSEVKLLDLFVFSAEEMKRKYMKMTHDNCEYTGVPESEYEGTSTTPEVTRRSEYVPTEYPEHPRPEITTPKSQPIEKTEKPCPARTPSTVETTKPCPEKPYESGEEAEIIAEDDEYNDQPPPVVGSVRGIPGVHYPNYYDVPITSFSCADKYIPGFYADLETGCQVFHVCYEHRRESFLCPVGTIFNQPILACDYWYSSNCSLAPVYYEVNGETDVSKDVVVEDFVSVIIDGKTDATEPQEQVLDDIAKFLPVKAKIVEFTESPEVKVVTKTEGKDIEDVASEIFENILSTATGVVSKTRVAIGKIPEPSIPKYEPVPVFKVKPVSVKAPFAKAVVSVTEAKLAAAVPSVIAKAKLAAAVPVAKVVAAKSVIPVVAKAKIAGAALPVVAAKAKVAAAVPLAAKAKIAGAALPVVAAKAKVAAAVPVVAKAKIVGAAVPVVAAKAKVAAAVPVVAKAKIVGAAVPVVAAKAKVAAAVPVVAAKAKVAAAVPVVAAKAKVAAAVPVVAAKAKVAGAAVPVVAKAKAAGAAIPVVAAKVAVAAPVVGKAKVAAAAVPIAAKVKLAGAVPKVVAKASVPVLKSKLIASALPFATAKLAAPVLKGKALKGAGVPLVKAQMFAVPLVKSKLAGSAPLLKAKLVKAAAISPLTKKALALGYMKLLKTKKLALMG